MFWKSPDSVFCLTISIQEYSVLDLEEDGLPNHLFYRFGQVRTVELFIKIWLGLVLFLLRGKFYIQCHRMKNPLDTK